MNVFLFFVKFYAPIYMMMFLENDALPDYMVYDIGKPLEL